MDALGIKKSGSGRAACRGKIGVEMAVNWPERVSKLVLSSIGYYESEGKNIQDPPNFRGKVEIKADGSHLMEWWQRSALWGHPLDITHDRTVEYIKAGPRGEELHWAGRNYDPRPRLPLVKCPTLVLSATRDPFCVVAENVHKLVPAASSTSLKTVRSTSTGSGRRNLPKPSSNSEFNPRLAAVTCLANRYGRYQMKRAYTDIPEGQVHYRIEGSGDVILLLHAGVTSSDEYSRVIPFLAKKILRNCHGLFRQR